MSTLVTWAKSVKSRDGNKCAKCFGTEKIHAHHTRPVARGGKNTLENGVTLCRKCHTAEHSLEFRGAEQERIAVGLKLPRWLVEWMREQPESQAVLIEEALKRRHKLKPPEGA
jgi:predicted restriction endonuclease